MGSRRIEESRRSGKRAGREAVHHIRDARRPPAHSTGSPTCGPRASGPPCVQRLERPEAGETPAVHHIRDARRPPAHSTGSPTSGPRASGPPCVQRLERPEAGGTPAVHHTRDDREPTSTRPTARGPVDRGPLARCASNDSSDPRRARRPRSTTRETPAPDLTTPLMLIPIVSPSADRPFALHRSPPCLPPSDAWSSR